MKQFHFSLEAVLRVRLEQLEKTRHSFAECLRWRVRAVALIEAAQAEIGSCHEALTARRECRTSRADQVLFLNALQYQQSLLCSHQEQLAKVEGELASRRAVMIAAQRKVDALERLREQKRHAHEALAQRREESMMDDLIAARYVLQMAEVAT